MDDAIDWAALVTVIVTTSASPVHPSTELIESTLTSLRDHAQMLRGCRTVIVCDGVRGVRAQSKYRSGRVTSQALQAYTEYKDELRALCSCGGRAGTCFEGQRCDVVELEEHHGFGFAVRRAMFHHVETPMVVVIQHDRTFTRPAPFFEDVAREMLRQGEDGAIGYVLLPITSTNNYALQWRTKLGQVGKKGHEADLDRFAIALGGDDRSRGCVNDACCGSSRNPGGGKDGSGSPIRKGETKTDAAAVLSEVVECGTTSLHSADARGAYVGGKHLLPCLRWYDSTHIAFSKFYREFVFSGERKLVKRGGFIEDKLGQAQSRDVLSRGLDATVPEWRLWLYQDGLGRAVSHLDGSSGASAAELDRRYPQRVAQRERRTQEENISITDFV